MTTLEIHDYFSKAFTKSNSGRYYRIVHELLPDIEIGRDTFILDYGCGTGILAHYIAQEYHCHIDAVDIAKEILDEAQAAWPNDDIRWIETEKFDFPEKKYNLIFSSQVIEHVHNVGNYLEKINFMLKDDGQLIIGLPNTANPYFFFYQMLFNEKRAKKISKDMLEHYDKGMHHINAWDALHFTNLLASCGFMLEKYIPTEGIALFPIPPFNIKYLDKKIKGRLKICLIQ